MTATAILPQGGIYEIRNINTGRVYIGSAVNFRKRFKEHRSLLRRGVHHSIKLQRSWAKNGESAFEFNKIEIISDKSLLIQAEQRWIDKHQAAKLGYNICPIAGSSLGVKASVETRAKMSASQKSLHADIKSSRCAHLKDFVKTAEHKAKIGAANKGKTPSDETRRKMSDAAKSHSEEVRKARVSARAWYRPSEETKIKISEKLKGIVVSDYTRAKIGAASLGRTHSEETKRKRLETRERNRLARLADA